MKEDAHVIFFSICASGNVKGRIADLKATELLLLYRFTETLPRQDMAGVVHGAVLAEMAERWRCWATRQVGGDL